MAYRKFYFSPKRVWLILRANPFTVGLSEGIFYLLKWRLRVGIEKNDRSETFHSRSCSVKILLVRTNSGIPVAPPPIGLMYLPVICGITGLKRMKSRY